MTDEQIAAVAKGLSEAQCGLLAEVCRTNGGGVRVRCKHSESGEVIPSHGPTRKLFEKGLIQGKAGSYETVVHTRDGLAVRRYLQEQG